MKTKTKNKKPVKNESTLNDRVRTYERVEVSNGKALKALLLLREAFDAKDVEGVSRNYNRLVRNIALMAENYRRFGRHTAFQNFGFIFDQVEEKSWKGLEDSLDEMRSGQTPSFDLYSQIENIQYDINSHGIERFDGCGTLHDLVRCLHVSALETLFSGEGVPGGVEEKQFRGDTFRIMRGDEGTNSDLLEALLKIYKERVEKQGTEHYKVVIAHDAMFMRAVMGCHFSYADIKMGEEDQNRFFIRFSNTDPRQYKYAPQRSEYVKQLMDHLGFGDIEQQGNDIMGVAYVGRKALPPLLTEVIRMFASTKDLDINERMPSKLDRAIKKFKEGTTNIDVYLDNLRY